MKATPGCRTLLLATLIAGATASPPSAAQTVTFTAGPTGVISEPTIPKVIDQATGKNRVFPNLVRAIERPGEVRPDILLVPGVNSVLPWVYGPVRVFRPSGAGSLADLTRSYFGNGALPSTGSSPDVAIGDFNGDGKADFFITESGWDAPLYPGSPEPGGLNTLLVSTPTGPYADRSSTLSRFRVPNFPVTTADVDGDGILDLYVEPLVPVPAPTNARLLMGRGDGTFDEVSSTLPIWLADNSLWKKSFIGAQFVDVDNDGFPDLVLGRFTAGSLILLNDGAGDFSKREPVPLPGTAFGDHTVTPAIAEIDANGDGYPDLVLVSIGVGPNGGAIGGQVQLFINRGDGTFADESLARLGPRATVFGNPGWDGVSVVDLNGDGKPDILLQNGGTDFAWINDGHGVFAPVAVSTLPPNSPGRIVAADVDGDGVLDLVALVYNTDGDIVYHSMINTAKRTVPSEPVMGAVVAGDAQVTVSFQPPQHNGPSAVTGYTATCRGSSGGAPAVATGAGSPITVTGLVNALPYFCVVTASSAQGNSLPSARSKLTRPHGTLTVVLAGNGVSHFSAGVTLTATLQGAVSATGTVNFRSFGTTIPGCGTRPVVANVATCATKTLAYGPNRIDALYSGDAGNRAAAAPAVWHTITGGIADVLGGNLPTIAAGTTRTVYLEPRNIGTAPLDLTGFEFAGPFALTHSTCGSTLAPDQRCLLNVAYSPTATSGPITGTLTVTHTGYNSPFVATLRGEGTALTAPTLAGAFSPSSVPEGNAAATLTFTLRNANTVALAGAKLGFNLAEQMLTTATPNAVNACGGAWSVPDSAPGTSLANRATLQFTGATIPAGGACVIAIDVVATGSSGTRTVFQGYFESAEIVSDFPPVSLTITQAPAGSQTLAVTKLGTGAGTVTSNPNGIACGTSCSAFFASGAAVTLTAAPNAGSLFAGWGGDCAGTGSCTVTLTRATNVTATFNVDMVASLEEPRDGATASGVSNLRGWVVSSQPIQRIDLYIDGSLAYTVPYGGTRIDVGTAFPGYPGSANSGFSMAYNYGNLSPGNHTFVVRATDNLGHFKDSVATFKVVRFPSSFMPNPADVSLLGASATIVDGNTVRLNNVKVEGASYNLTLRWNPATQGFELIGN